ncbi:MAG: Rieske 2Fe-2S domain-containing protein [Chloroflexi bacterium]|nr:Rieske 2Fe-2S domain-containing protein [Chloroflexota bacterium]MCH7655615.1 Rieske 2Fe-2S domain-containing protein [Chloroflexota bacterium]
MLSPEENELLTRVGAGTPMGELMRQYWLPCLISTELAPDGDVLRIRLLGEDLLAFRDTQGRVGVVGPNCAHRGASLFYARNEEGGLRCPYHGWKYDVDGACVDMPNEPPESSFKDKVRQPSYRTAERNGVVWVYMGRLSDPPPLPELEWNMLPEAQRHVAKRIQFCNWAQAVEGEIDQSHVSFLHTPGNQLKIEAEDLARSGVVAWRKRDKHPRFHVQDMDYGVLIGAQRDVGEGMSYWRLTQFLLPFYTMTGPYGEDPTRHTRCWVPVDDHTTMVFAANYHPLRPLTEKEVAKMRAGSGAGFVGDPNFAPPTNAPFGRWIPKASRSNDFFFDRASQQTDHFSGIPEFWAQDAGMQEGMGPIYDRTKEHLGTTDAAIIRVRRSLAHAAKALLEAEEPPPGVLHPDIYRVRGAAALLPADADWVAETEEIRKLVPGVNPSAPGRQ